MLRQALRARLKGKTLIVGVGNTLRGDDGAGPLCIERLAGRVTAGLLDAGETPESYLGKILAEQPATLVVVDAVEMGAVPGSAALIEVDELARRSCSTHRLSLALFMQYVQKQTGADVFLLGVQPGAVAFGEGVSPAVRETVECLAECLVEILA